MTQTRKYNAEEHVSTADTSEACNIVFTTTPDIEKAAFTAPIQLEEYGFRRHLTTIGLEMAAFAFTFSYMITKVSSTTMILDKVCSVHFSYPASICSSLENNTEIKMAVERLATNYQLGHNLIQMVPAAVLGCFIGPWSDQYGRKFPALLALFGMILDAVGSTICAIFLETRVEYYFIPALFTGIFGGRVSVLTTLYSSASDCVSIEDRTVKYAVIEISILSSFALGTIAGGWIYKFFGYPPVFLLSAGGLCFSFICVIFLLKETRGLNNSDPWSIKLRKLLSCKGLKESLTAATKERPHQGRRQIILIIISTCILFIASAFAGDIGYLYVHHQFGWSNTTYSTLASISLVLTIIGLILVIPFLKRFEVSDPVVGLIGTVSLLGRSLGIGLAWKPEVYLLAYAIGSLNGCSSLGARSRISKVVPNEDLGKIFSFVATAETLLPILMVILMSQIFNASLEIFPGTVYVILALLLCLPLGVFSWMTCLPDMSYEDIDHKEQKKTSYI